MCVSVTAVLLHNLHILHKKQLQRRRTMKCTVVDMMDIFCECISMYILGDRSLFVNGIN